MYDDRVSRGRKRVLVDSEALVRDYLAGASLRTLVPRYGVSYGTLHSRLCDAGIARRKPGGRRVIGNGD